MPNLQLYYPAKPYHITQAWGISNPSYLQFGFSKHNGEDFMIGKDNRTHCPLKAIVEEVGFNDSAGNYIRLVSQERFDVLGANCYIGMMFMHHEQILAKKGDILDVGDIMGIPDNTGFSTGPHTHGSYYRLSQPSNVPQNRLDTDIATNNTFDPHPYWTGFCAQDYKIVWTIQQLINLYKQLGGVK